MKIVLTTLNAKYIHTNLAIRYLKQVLAPIADQVVLKEYTVNHQINYIISDLYETQPEVLCFSCNIWNIAMTLDIVSTMKKIMPEVLIVLGGPEVSFETRELMEAHDAIDIVVIGEGEQTLQVLVEKLMKHQDYSEVEGIAYRAKGQVLVTAPADQLRAMEAIPFPYVGEPLDPDKIVYYESMRGCPFQCQYCLSSTIQGVRFLPIERVKKELQYFLDARVRQVKFVDRTFNAQKSHAKAIFEYLLENHNGVTNFHFEIAADLLDDELLEVLRYAPVGLFQFEIGVQSTHLETLEAIQRVTDLEKLKARVETISSFKNIHQHLDLIVGLPKEDYFTFRRSFDQVFSLRPEKLQVGFLKLLKGSGLRTQAVEYGLVSTQYSPYEILETAVLSYGEVVRLKGIEEMVEIFWNSSMFTTTLGRLLQKKDASAFKLFERLWDYWQQQGYQHIAHSKNRLYEILYKWIQGQGLLEDQLFKDLLKFDFLKSSRTYSIPPLFREEMKGDFKNQCHQFLQAEENVLRYLPQYGGVSAKQIMKQVWFERFAYDVISLEAQPNMDSAEAFRENVVLFHYDLENKALSHSIYNSVLL